MQPVQHRRRQSFLLNINKVASGHAHLWWQCTRNDFIPFLPRRRQRPRIFRLLVVRDTPSDTDNVAAAFSIAHYAFNICERHSTDARQKRPLVGMRIEIGIQKNAVTMASRHLLQRQGDQITKAAFWHGVLTWKKAIIGIQSELMPPLHSPSKNRGAKFSRQTGG